VRKIAHEKKRNPLSNLDKILQDSHVRKFWWGSVEAFLSGGGQIWNFPFPIGFHRRPYNTRATVGVCDAVYNMLSHDDKIKYCITTPWERKIFPLSFKTRQLRISDFDHRPEFLLPSVWSLWVYALLHCLHMADCENIMPSTKLELHDTLHSHQRRTEIWLQFTERWTSDFEICKQDKHTGTLL